MIAPPAVMAIRILLGDVLRAAEGMTIDSRIALAKAMGEFSQRILADPTTIPTIRK